MIEYDWIQLDMNKDIAHILGRRATPDIWQSKAFQRFVHDNHLRKLFLHNYRRFVKTVRHAGRK